MITHSAFKVVQDALASYIEGWPKDDHEAAMKCRECEEWLFVGNGIFNAISTFDEGLRRCVLSGEAEYDPQDSAVIKQAYRWWLGPCDSLIAAINHLRHEGFVVDHSEKFLSNCREAKGILIDDAEFFDGEALVNLRDEAIDEHRSGDSLEYGSR